MTTRHKRGQRKRESKRTEDQSSHPVPNPTSPPTRFQRTLFIGVVAMLVVWFAYLLYVAFGT